MKTAKRFVRWVSRTKKGTRAREEGSVDQDSNEGRRNATTKNAETGLRPFFHRLSLRVKKRGSVLETTKTEDDNTSIRIDGQSVYDENSHPNPLCIALSTTGETLSLPPEIILIILEYITSLSPSLDSTPSIARKTLASCARINKQWNACTHPLLFNHVSISSEKQLKRFIALLDSQSEASHGIGSSVKAVTVINPRVACLSQYRTPRFETFVGCSRWHSDHDNHDSPYAKLIRTAIFDVFPSQLTEVKKITLYGYTDNGRDLDDSKVANLAKFESVKEVMMDSCIIGTSVIKTFVGAIPNLDNFLLVDPHPHNGNEDARWDDKVTNRPLEGPRLRSFTCYAGPMTRDTLSLQWLLDTPSVKSLRSLSIMFEIDAPGPFQKLLETVGPQLEHLSLEIEGTPLTHWIGYDRYKSLSLASFTSLKSFVIRANIDPCTLLNYFLSQLSPSTHTSLSLIVVILSNIGWTKRFFTTPEGRNTLPDLFDNAPILRSKDVRVVFVNDPLPMSDFARRDIIHEFGDEFSKKEVQTTQMLKAYLDVTLGGLASGAAMVGRASKDEGSLVRYEVMDRAEAAELRIAKPIEL